jgi:mono/diheme cytochrome c family protein
MHENVTAAPAGAGDQSGGRRHAVARVVLRIAQLHLDMRAIAGLGIDAPCMMSAGSTKFQHAAMLERGGCKRREWIVRTIFAACVVVGGSFAAISGAGAETALERGTYLMKSIVDCGQCHTDSAPGSPELAGGKRFVDIAYTAYAPNITPDPATGTGNWTDDEIIGAIRDGKRPHGSTIGPPMPIRLYRGMSDDDARAIVAYLRSVKPVHNVVRKSLYRIELPDSYGPPVGSVAAVSAADPVAYGRYLATALGHCMECHSTPGDNGPDLVGSLGAGGVEFRGPWGVSVSANITPNGIGFYSDDELATIITKGIRPDGTRLQPPMPVASYANMTDKDVTAIIAYLRSLPKK